MPLFAHNGSPHPVSAFDAKPHIPYSCLECRSALKLRKQKGKIPHFYHLKTSPSCRLYSKSEEHLLIQLAIQKILPPNETTLEHPLPSIHRIADVLWEKQKIVFEIQCSPISEEEVKKRFQDYASLNYQIVWILDDRLFNKKIVRKSENYLRRNLCYFVQIKPNFLFYDQLEIIDFSKRIKKGPKIPIDLTKLHSIKQTPSLSTLSQIKERIANSSRYFENDLVHKALLASTTPSFAHTFDMWRFFESEHAQNRRMAFMGFIKKIYVRLLEKALQKVV